MTSVRFLPVAEQYPSRIATSSLVASHLTSGITQRPKKIPIQPEGQTGKARVSHRRRETTSVASCGFLGLAALSSAQISPIDIRAQIFAAHRAKGFALKVDTKTFAELLTGRNAFSDVPDRCSAARREIILLLRRHAVDKFKQFVHAAMLPLGNLQSNTYGLFRVFGFTG